MRLLKWAGMGLAGVIGVVVVAFGLVYLTSESRINQEWSVNPPAVTAASFVAASADGSGMDDSGARSGEEADDAMAERIEWGAHIAETRGCRDCHGQDLGGGLFADAMPVMQLYGTNLTPAGAGATYTDADWVRAIRHGIGPDGKALLFMPSYEYYYTGDRDLAALIAYLKSLPAVEREVPESKVGPLGRALYVMGKLPLLAAELIDHEAPRPVAPPRGATLEYGEYLAMNCIGCHGDGFSGGLIPGVPPEWPAAANIPPDPETGIGGWSREQFVAAFTTGVRPDGRQIQPQFMPWPNFAQFEPDEVEAVWMYLQTVPAKEHGGR